MTIIQEACGSEFTPSGRCAERRVHLDHLAAHRRVQLRDRLDRLDRAEDVPLAERLADVRQFEVDDVAQLFLRVVGDADVGLVPRRPVPTRGLSCTSVARIHGAPQNMCCVLCARCYVRCWVLWATCSCDVRCAVCTCDVLVRRAMSSCDGARARAIAGALLLPLVERHVDDPRLEPAAADVDLEFGAGGGLGRPGVGHADRLLQERRLGAAGDDAGLLAVDVDARSRAARSRGPGLRSRPACGRSPRPSPS